MLVLNKENMAAYLREKLPDFAKDGSLTVSAIGDSEEDNPGLINFIFRVSNGKKQVIVKQGLQQIRAEVNQEYRVPLNRNRLEYTSLKLRGSLVPDYVPEVYGVDLENNVFFMEDVSYLGNARVELTKNRIFPNLGRQVAEYVARSCFYTSEFYLDTPTFRELANTYTNTEMRRVMEHWVFLRESPFADSPITGWMRQELDHDDELMAQTYLLRHQFMSTPEAMIHGDLHTSNLFLDKERLKVIDMEYTFAGPVCYDIGYFLNSMISQYCSAFGRSFPTEQVRHEFQVYILRTIVETYEYFMQYFKEFWDQDAKDYYRKVPAWRDKLMSQFLPDILGYASIPGLGVILSGGDGWLDFNAIPDEAFRLDIKYLSAVVSRHFLVNRFRYTSMEQAIEDLIRICHEFLAKRGRL